MPLNETILFSLTFAIPTSWPHPNRNLAAFAAKLIAQRNTAMPKGTESLYRSAKGKETRDETKEEVLPETKPKASERPR